MLDQSKHYPIIIEIDEDGMYIVSCPTLKGCRSYGSSIDEAMENIREAIELCLEDESMDSHKNNEPQRHREHRELRREKKFTASFRYLLCPLKPELL